VEESGEELGGWLGGREGEEEETKRGDGVQVELYRRALLCRREGVGEQAQGRAQVDGRHRRALGCAWRPLGTGGLTWQDEGRPAEAARAVGEAARQHVGEGRAAQACSGSRSGRRRWIMRAR
jgi:hypothetical protein